MAILAEIFDACMSTGMYFFFNANSSIIYTPFFTLLSFYSSLKICLPPYKMNLKQFITIHVKNGLGM